jgi:crossover junction endodeoxyribonuclease RuvC
MVTIGIDPGIERVGIGIVSSNNKKMTLEYQKLIKTSSKLSISKRLRIIHEELNGILDKYRVDHASVEKLFFAKNIKTALTVSEARGVILLTLEQRNIPVFEYTPLQLKQAIIGYGRAVKNQIQEFVVTMLGLKEKIKLDDVADGIALAIVHLNTFKTISKIKGRIKSD